MKKSIGSLNLIIFLSILSLFLCSYIYYLNAHENLYFWVLLLLIVFIFVAIILVITIPYILIKENLITNVGMILIASIIIFLITSIICIYFNPIFFAPIKDINDLVSLRMFIITLLVIPEFLIIASFMKLWYT